MPPVTVRVPAKVNLYLGVGKRRRDGYHELANVFQAVSLYDEVTAAPGPGLSVRVRGDQAKLVPTDSSNLALRAAALLAETTGVDAAVRLTINKAIPIEGGMAGGSADAAGALLACDELWGTGVGRDTLLRLGASLGADVPFALTGGTALGTERGDRLTPVLARGTYDWVLALADGGLSTAAVYAELDRQRADRVFPEPGVSEALMSALRAGDPAALGRALTNDLGPAALQLRPALARTIEAGLDLGVLGAVISGSGATCAFLCPSEEEAIRVAAALAGAGVCRSTRRVHGPVPGARIVDEADRP
ncbi:MAG: 4-diphosphocytidyl-2-C-methyl-D-erythritol kinase [Frankiales bacterium]|nr:4-diphosphocytidyl-2-C-methyl-D-erythritol kinase [Frankiales bacterium]